jgi:predicted MPP superfamily phosphohydrolase
MVSFRTVYQHVVAHWRAIILLLILALATFLIAYPDRGSPIFLRHCVTITNGLKPDLVVLTGDYWDPEAEGEAVRALAGLHAPHGVFGCLGNHEQEGEIEEPITRLFAARGIRILRQERVAIRLSGETLNLIGMDEPRGPEWEGDVCRRLQQTTGFPIRLGARPEISVVELSST